MRSGHGCLAAAALTLGFSAQAAPIDVSVEVAGTPGAWIANFSFSNSLSTQTSLYFLGVEAEGWHDPAPAPFIWAFAPTYNTSWAGGADVTYNNLWLDLSLTGLSSGKQMSGFTVPISTVAAPTSFQWFAMTRGQEVTEPFDFGSPSTAGYQGVVRVAAVPEPGSYTLFVGGMAAMYFVRRRKGSHTKHPI